MATFEQRDALARRFHETYERLAPNFGYKTREDSAVPWEDVPQANTDLMRAVAGEIIDAAVAAAPPADDVREAFTNGWYSARQNPGIAAATHSPDFPGEVRPRGTVADAVIVDMLTAFYGEEREGWSSSKVRRMRAALEAARAVQS